MLDVTLENNSMRFGERFALALHRTLRIPDDGRIYPLPPGLGRFPLFDASDYRDRVPSPWLEDADVFIPMYQREALWLGFAAADWKPNAVKITIGGINAISGESLNGGLNAEPQDYIVCPPQPWLDGINTGRGSIRQFVAMPLGRGYTVEAALSGSEKIGGIQITVFEPKAGRFPDKPPVRFENGPVRFAAPRKGGASQAMGLGAGGRMKQKIYPDPYGIDVWDPDNYGRVAVHLVNSSHFLELTGVQPPPTPVDAKTYTEHGLPWFDLYDESSADLAPSQRFDDVRSIAEIDARKDETDVDNPSFDVSQTQTQKLGDGDSG